MAGTAQLTPMMAQYRRIKGELPGDALLLFRLGDFYEMFFEDAQIGAQLLNLALTKRQGVPMCGIPHHAAAAYIGKLLKAGRKVAICDQLEEARPGKLVKREVTQILSPGTHFDERMLAAERNNFLAAVKPAGEIFGLALVDLTTGDFRTTELEGDAALLAELERLRPAEIIYPSEAASLCDLLRGGARQNASGLQREPGALPSAATGFGWIVNGYDDWTFAPETALYTVRDHFKVASLDGFGLKDRTAAIGAAGAALHYLTQHLRRDVQHLTRLSFYRRDDFLALDSTTLRHLEVLEPLRPDAPRNASLYGALNRTVTPMGARRLRDWLSQPLAAVEPIRRRQEAVQAFVENPSGLEQFRAQLAEVRDLERTLGRLSAGGGNARDLVALRLALEQIPQLRQTLAALLRPDSAPATGALGEIAQPPVPQFLREEFAPDDPGPLSPTGQGVFGPVFAQLRGKPRAAIALLLKLRTGEVPGALFHPEVGEIDLVWGEARQRGAGYGLAKIERWHPEMLSRLPERLAAMRKLRETENTVILGSPDDEAVVRLNAFGTPKRWLLTAYEKVKPASAERTIDVPGQEGTPRQTPASGGGPADNLDALPEQVNGRAGHLLAERSLPLLLELLGQLCELPDLVDLIARAIVDDPPLAVKEGGMIRDGFSPELDELRAAQRGGKDWIAKLQADEIARTGIASLKVRFNSVFGYYIEVTKANLDKVPPHYIRKQTIAGGERYITPELKEMEGKILGAEERGMKLEYELFQRVREEVLGRLRQIQQTAAALAQLDVLAGFADTARIHNYCCPQVADEGVIFIRDGRHPVLEQQMLDERFVPNDAGLASAAGFPSPRPPQSRGQPQVANSPNPDSRVEPTNRETEGAPAPSPAWGGRPSNASADAGAPVHGEEAQRQSLRPTFGQPLPAGRGEGEVFAFPQIALITGPNMAGKSTYIRQVALIVLLAHTGSFVPAAEARIDLVDRIFTRIGASDDLARGQSTFMVEMTETANILNNATPRSLVILDEIGRGTSTFDGLALAWSIVEHLHNVVGAKTLFATHYHELTELAARLPRLKNFNVAVREWHDQIVFLRKIVEGGTDKSYGIHVARLAGVPKEVLERAKVILANLEASELTPEGTVRQSRRQQDRDKLKHLAPPPQLDLFG